MKNINIEENLISLRNSFFALYQGRGGLMVFKSTDVLKSVKVTIGEYIMLSGNKCLSVIVKDITYMSDEDVNDLTGGIHKNINTLLEYYHGNVDNFIKNLQPFEIDFLRYKGYALPWMKISIKKQEELDWIVFENNVK